MIAALGLAPHPEGGHYRETYRHRPSGGGRGAMTSICYLLRAGERSHWHRLADADELWHFHAGAPLRLESADGAAVETRLLGPDPLAGQQPQVLVPAGCWQAACSTGDWSLAGCTVAPAFDFARFELAPPGWRPGS